MAAQGNTDSTNTTNRLLEQCSKSPEEHHSLVPTEQSWSQFRESELRDGRELLKKEWCRWLPRIEDGLRSRTIC